MARITYVPFNQADEDEKDAVKAERRALRTEKCEDLPDQGPARFNGKNPDEPEYSSVEDFAEFLLDNDESEFDFGDLNCLNARTGVGLTVIKAALKEYGLTLKLRAPEHATRGFTSNPNTRWTDCPSHGGGGGGAIQGMAY